MAGVKIFKKSQIMPRKQLRPTRQTSCGLNAFNTDSDRVDNAKLLRIAQTYWDGLSNFRRDRRNTRNWVLGEQWGELMPNPNGHGYITEEEYIRQQGGFPLKQNLLAQQLNNLVGQYRSNPTKSLVVVRAKDRVQEEEMLNNALMSAHAANMGGELDASTFREYLISGCALQKLRYDYIRERDTYDVVFTNVTPPRLFFNPDVTDVRGSDINFIGELIDIPLEELLSNSVICKTKADEERVREWYRTLSADSGYASALTKKNVDGLNFLIPSSPSLCRVIEIWYLAKSWKLFAYDPMRGERGFTDMKEARLKEINQQRIEQAAQAGIAEDEVALIEYKWRNELSWYCKMLTPNGDCLWAGESPYMHQSHPYALKLHPLIDGEVYGYMKNPIDQQRAINRNMLLMDLIIRHSAKGTWLIPEGAIPDGYEPKEYVDELERVNGYIIYKEKQGVSAPQQIASNSTNIGVKELLALQMQLMNDVSGVHGAIQGKSPNSSTSGKLYEQETANASINTLDLMMSFSSFREMRDRKALKLIRQYYTDRRPLVTMGTQGSRNTIYDPTPVKDLDSDVAVVQGNDTPAYRLVMEETLRDYVMKGFLQFADYLKVSTMPYAKELLQVMEQSQQQMAQGAAPAGMTPELMEQAAQANPQFMQMIGGQQ